MNAKPNASQYADTIIKLIDEDIAAGQVPATVASFTELHDYVDANEYMEDAGVPYVTGSREESDLIAEVGDEVAARLAARTAMATAPDTGKPLPFARQPRGFQIAETVKVVAGFVMCDRSGLTRDQKIDWYMTHGGPAEFDGTAQAEIRAGVVRRLAADA